MPFSVALLSSVPSVLKGQGDRWNYAASLTPDARLRGSVMECGAVRRCAARPVEPAPSSLPRTSGMTGGGRVDATGAREFSKATHSKTLARGDMRLLWLADWLGRVSCCHAEGGVKPPQSKALRAALRSLGGALGQAGSNRGVNALLEERVQCIAAPSWDGRLPRNDSATRPNPAPITGARSGAKGRSVMVNATNSEVSVTRGNDGTRNNAAAPDGMPRTGIGDTPPQCRFIRRKAT